jgi:transposase
MLKFREAIKIYVSSQPIDARKSIDGLCSLVLEHFAHNPQCGNVFIFFNKSRDKVKILFWHVNGFVLCYKRLERHRFVFSANEALNVLEITQAQLHGLLAGLDFALMRDFPEIDYHQYA